MQELRHINRCMFPAPRLQGTEGGDQGCEIWLLFESVPAQGYLPAYQQRHSVKFKLGDPAPCICSCPHFTSTKLPCSAVCAVLALKNIQSIEEISTYMIPMWLVTNHPLFALTTQSLIPVVMPQGAPVLLAANASADTAMAISTLNRQAVQQMQLPTDATGRLEVLTQLCNQLLPTTAASASLSKDLHSLLVQHRSRMFQSQSVVCPPRSEISRAQNACGTGPANAVMNMSNHPRYRRNAGQRIGTARSRDPSCYTVYKTAMPGAQVQCLCGGFHINNHKVSSLRSAHVMGCNTFLLNHRLHISIEKHQNIRNGSKTAHTT